MKNHHEPEIEQEYTVLKMSKALYENSNIHLRILILQSKILEFWSSPDCFSMRESVVHCL